MRLSPVLSPTMALCVMSLFLGGLDLYIHADWIMVRIEVLPEDLKQQPVVAESWASKWPSSIGLRSPHGWVRVRTGIVPEGLKKPPIVAESWASEWSGSIGLRSPHGWVRVRTGVVPEGLEQPPVGAESMASDVPYPLGQLWDYLLQVEMTWLLRRAWQAVWLLCMAWTTLGLWRIVKRPQGQGRGRTASSSMGTDCWGKGTFSRYELLCRLEANTALLLRCLRHVYRLCLKELRHQHYKKKAREKDKKRRDFSSSLCNSS
ncbi:uncharacterized protein M6G45_005564 isoform 1-T3 [Spheniscus humboldti]